MVPYTVAFLNLFLSLAAAAPVSDCIAEAFTTSSCTTVTETITTTLAACASTEAVTTTEAAAEAATTAATAVGANVQAFAGALGGPPPPVISGTGDRPFSVNGDTFVGAAAALGRSCDVQHNACADAANAGELSGGVGQCDKQNDECRQSNAVSKRGLLSRRGYNNNLAAGGSPSPVFMSRGVRRAALDLGSCGDPSIIFGEGLDGRKEAAFIAANQDDFDHGSALKIGVIADFVCQRLKSSCDAPDDTQAACASASSAAVAETQDQAAADAFNNILVAGGAATAAPQTAVFDDASSATAAASAALETTVVRVVTTCTWISAV